MPLANAEKQRRYRLRKRASYVVYDVFSSGNDDLIVLILDSWLENHLSGFYSNLEAR